MIGRLTRKQLGAAAVLTGLGATAVAFLLWEQWVLAGMVAIICLLGVGLIAVFSYARLGKVHRRITTLNQEFKRRDEGHVRRWNSVTEDIMYPILHELRENQMKLIAQQEAVQELERRGRRNLSVMRQGLGSVETRLATLETSVTSLDKIEDSLSRLSQQSSSAERKVLNRLRKDNVFETIRSRLEQTERRLVGIIEEERLAASDRWQDVQDHRIEGRPELPVWAAASEARLLRAIEGLGEDVVLSKENLQASRQDGDLRGAEESGRQKEILDAIEDTTSQARQRLITHVTHTVRDGTRQIEALLHLLPKTSVAHAPMPPTGGYAIDAQALHHLIAILEKFRPRLILELGGGTSTIWMGHVCREYGAKIVSVDHLEQYHEQTVQSVARHDLNDIVECRLAPLQEISLDQQSFHWYSLDAFEDLYDVDVLLVDGPPESVGQRARFPALPSLEHRLAASVVVMLDDTHREAEREILESWKTLYPEFEIQDAGVSRLGVLSRTATEGARASGSGFSDRG